MKRYAYRDWDSVLASIGHGALKEGQVINKMLDERNKKLKKEVTDTTILDNMAIGWKQGSGDRSREVEERYRCQGNPRSGGSFFEVLQPGSGR